MICSYVFGDKFLKYKYTLGGAIIFIIFLSSSPFSCPPPIITQFVPTKTEYGRGERGEGRGVSALSYLRKLWPGSREWVGGKEGKERTRVY